MKEELHLVFVECVRRQVIFLQEYTIFEIANVVFFNVDPCVINKELSDRATRLMQKSFFFSYDFDLTRPLSPTNAAEFQNVRRPLWMYMANYSLMSRFLTGKACEWVIPVVFGEFTSVRFNVENNSPPGRLWVCKKLSMFNTAGVPEYSQSLHNIVGAPRFHVIDVALKLNQSICGASLHFVTAPKDSYLSDYRVARLVQLLKSTAECTRIVLLKEDETDLSVLEAQLLKVPNSNIEIIDFGRIKDLWFCFNRIFHKCFSGKTVSFLQVALVMRDVEGFSSKYLSFVLTTFLFACKQIISASHANNNGIKSNGFVDDQTDDLEDSFDEQTVKESVDKGFKITLSGPDQLGIFESFAPIQHQSTHNSIPEHTPPTDSVSKTGAESHVSSVKKHRSEDEVPSFPIRKFTHNSAESSDYSDNETKDTIDYEHPKFIAADTLINLKITKLNEEVTSLREINEYFSNKTSTGVVESLYRLMNLKTERYDSNLDKIMHGCRQLSRYIFSSHLETIDKLKESKNNAIFEQFEMKLCLFSANVGGFLPTADTFAQLSFLNGEKPLSSDIIVVCLQEAILMKASHLKDIVLDENDGEIRTIWCELLQKRYPEFVVGFAKQLCGLLMIVLLRRSLSTKIDIQLSESNIVRLGTLNFANKGAILVSFKINHQRILIANCHFAAGNGEKKLSKRIDNLRSVMRMIEESQNKHDLIFIVGDLNFRVNRSMDKANQFLAELELIKEKLKILRSLFTPRMSLVPTLSPWISEFEILRTYCPPTGERHDDFEMYKFHWERQRNLVQEYLKKDELSETWPSVGQFASYELIPVSFPPTYRFYVGRTQHDFKEGKRIPSFTDRIIMNKAFDAHFELEEYWFDPNTFVSDHRPIYVLGKLKILSERLPEFSEAFDERYFKKCAHFSPTKDLTVTLLFKSGGKLISSIRPFISSHFVSLHKQCLHLRRCFLISASCCDKLSFEF